jgi:hypothetical protein
MSVLILDSDGSHAPVVKTLLSLGSYDILYYSDTRSAPFDELSPLTRVSRLLMLLHTHSRHKLSHAVILGRGMSSPPREAIELGARRAGLELVHGVDLVADQACSVLGFGGLCLVGDSCVTEADIRGRLGRSDLFEIRWARIAPLYPFDEPLRPILKSWGKSVGAYVLATPSNERISSQIAREGPGAQVVDEYEHLALSLGERLPESRAPHLRVCVSEGASAVVARLKSRLGNDRLSISQIGMPEAAPMEGPFAISLDMDGLPA